MPLLMIKFLFLVIPVFVGVAFYTLLERKILSIVGFRLGPNKVSFYGILQPMGDAVKLFNKEINNLSNYTYFFHYLSCVAMISSSIFLWIFFYSEPAPLNLKVSLLVLMLLLGLNSLVSVLSGWSTFSKYPLIGMMRTVAQLISYEASLYLCLFFFLFLFSSFSIYGLQSLSCVFLFVMMPYCAYIWVPSFLAELNRTPYDFSEGESELVSGFNTEFGSGAFTLLFLSEYANIIFFSFLTCYLFFSGLLVQALFLTLFFIIWIRSVLPRYRYDKLMMLAWKFFIPFLTVMLLVLASSLY